VNDRDRPASLEICARGHVRTPISLVPAPSFFAQGVSAIISDGVPTSSRFLVRTRVAFI